MLSLLALMCISAGNESRFCARINGAPLVCVNTADNSTKMLSETLNEEQGSLVGILRTRTSFQRMID